jgi:hypothetical protein
LANYSLPLLFYFDLPGLEILGTKKMYLAPFNMYGDEKMLPIYQRRNIAEGKK